VILFQTLYFREQKDETIGALYDRLIGFLKNASYNLSRIRFTLPDFPKIIRKKGGVERVLKDYPELACFRGSFVSILDQNRVEFISNEEQGQHLFPMEPETLATQASRGPIDPEVLSSILHRCPRTIPFFSGDIVFDELDTFNLSGIPLQKLPIRAQPNSVRRPNLRLSFTNAGGSRGQSQFLRARIALPEPIGGKLLSYPTITDQLIDKIGRVSTKSVSLLPPAEDLPLIESKIELGNDIVERFARNPFHGRLGIQLPVQLPEIAQGSRFGVPLIERADAGIPSIKDLVKHELGPLGYRYSSKLSGRGNYVMSKVSSRNNTLSFGADASPMGGQFCSTLTIKLPFARFTVDIQLPPNGRNYPINAHIPQVVANSAFVVKQLEDTFVSEIEELFGPSPSWFNSLATGC
jgi:hypothetical protein